MMRSACLYSKFKRPLCGAALLLMAGCAGTQDGGVDAQADAGSVPVAVETALTEIPETFTTVGKPTKTIETPWGPREIYDPAQDEEVKQSVAFWHQANIEEFESLREKFPQDHSYYHSAMQTHKLDMMRLGCELPEVRFHWFDDAFRELYMDLTPVCEPAFGKPEPSACEAEKMQKDHINYPNRHWRKGFKYPSVGFDYSVVGLKRGDLIAYGDEAEESLEIFTDISCVKWLGIRDTFSSYENIGVITRNAFFKSDYSLWPGHVYLDEFCAKLEPEIRFKNKFCGTYPVPQKRGWPVIPNQLKSTEE